MNTYAMYSQLNSQLHEYRYIWNAFRAKAILYLGVIFPKSHHLIKYLKWIKSKSRLKNQMEISGGESNQNAVTKSLLISVP